MDWDRHFTYTRLALGLALCFTPALSGDISGGSTNPFYSAQSIVQAADQTSGTLAPNSIATLYGTNLAFTTHALTSADLVGGDLPLSLAEVSVYVNGEQANLFYVSPGQINFLIPYDIVTSTAVVYVNRQSVIGPYVTIPLATTSPALFQWSGNLAVAEHADGSLVSPLAPAVGGEVIVLFAAGLGRTSPDISSGFVVQLPASILYASQLQVLLNGVPCPPASIYYAGVTPGFAGLYQINLQLPPILPANPEIRVAIGPQISPAAVQLPVQ